MVVSVVLMIENLIQIECGIRNCVDVSSKIQQTCACENNRCLKIISNDFITLYDEIIDAAAKFYSEPTQITPVTFNDKKPTCTTFYSPSYLIPYSLLLLPHYTLIKTKASITILP